MIICTAGDLTSVHASAALANRTEEVSLQMQLGTGQPANAETATCTLRRSDLPLFLMKYRLMLHPLNIVILRRTPAMLSRNAQPNLSETLCFCDLGCEV